jgi:hypothetical protein
MIDRFVCSFDEQHYWMLIHFASIECLTNQGTRQPALQAKPCSVLATHCGARRQGASGTHSSVRRARACHVVPLFCGFRA